MSQYLIDELATKSNVHVEQQTEVVSAQGGSHLEAIVVRNRRTGAVATLETNSLFVLIGADADTDALPSTIVRDELGYICTGRDIRDLERFEHELWPLERDPYLLETSVPGIFAAGDIRHGSIKRVASSVGEGSMSIAFVHQFLRQFSRDTVVAPGVNGEVTKSPGEASLEGIVAGRSDSAPPSTPLHGGAR